VLIETCTFKHELINELLNWLIRHLDVYCQLISSQIRCVVLHRASKYKFKTTVLASAQDNNFNKSWELFEEAQEPLCTLHIHVIFIDIDLHEDGISASLHSLLLFGCRQRTLKFTRQRDTSCPTGPLQAWFVVHVHSQRTKYT
jgi:hypothetical protein